MMVGPAERLSLQDDSLLAGHAEHSQLYAFVAPLARGKRVLDAACGTGYGSDLLSRRGADHFLGVDISEEAIVEAMGSFGGRANLSFDRMDLQKLDDRVELSGVFDVIVNLHALPHLSEPDRFLSESVRLLTRDGVLAIAVPNARTVALSPDGNSAYPYHHRLYGEEDLRRTAGRYFPRVHLFGQWRTHQGRLRVVRAQQLFDQLCELYFNPIARIGRALRKSLGKAVMPPPELHLTDSFEGDHAIAPIEADPFPWPPETLIAVCSREASSATLGPVLARSATYEPPEQRRTARR
jgi:SAM-dependent methyltransferase